MLSNLSKWIEKWEEVSGRKEIEVMQVAEHIPRVVHFSIADEEGVEMPHDNVLVVEAIIHNFKVQKILMDDGSN